MIVNQLTLAWPKGRMIIAAARGPIAEPTLPPTWNSDCAKPCRPPEARRAIRDDSGWKIDDPRPIKHAASSKNCEGMRKGQKGDPGDAQTHAGGRRIGHRIAVDDEADERLEDRGGELKSQCYQADLAEVEGVAVFEDRVDRGQERLHRVVQHVRRTQRHQHRHGGRLRVGSVLDCDRAHRRCV